MKIKEGILMADVRPFKAIYFNKDRVDLKKVIMPPYDIIRDTAKYYDSDPHNIVRIDKAKEEPGDNQDKNRYTRSREAMDEWLRGDILVKGAEEAFYVYSQDYKLPDGSKKNMISFYAAVKIEEFDKKIVLPHERTHSGPKIDRLDLMRRTFANTSPILSLYFDPKKAIHSILKKYASKKDVFLGCQNDGGISYKMWKVTDNKDIAAIRGYLKDAQLFIADGHHRYETAMNFRNEMKQKKGITGASPYDCIMMVLISMEHAGTSILPTHRMMKKFRAVDIGNDPGVKKYFSVKKLKNGAELRKLMTARGKKKLLGAVNKDGCFLLELKEAGYLRSLEGAPHIKEYYFLSVSVLHSGLFDKALGIPEKEILEAIDYTQDIDEAMASVPSGSCETAFLVQPATVDEVRIMSLNNEVMPQKSTYFLPKLATGFLINPLG
jgi:uncharacterized protein (DUF1015 family)